MSLASWPRLLERRRVAGRSRGRHDDDCSIGSAEAGRLGSVPVGDRVRTRGRDWVLGAGKSSMYRDDPASIGLGGSGISFSVND